MLQQQVIHNIQAPRRVVISKFVFLAYVAPNRYVVEFHRNGRIHYTKERSGKNHWLLYIYAITRLELFTGGLRVLNDKQHPMISEGA